MSKKDSNKTVIVVEYVGSITGENPSIECVVDDFNAWLTEHNENRIGCGEEPESEYDFKRTSMPLVLYNTGEENEI